MGCPPRSFPGQNARLSYGQYRGGVGNPTPFPTKRDTDHDWMSVARDEAVLRSGQSRQNDEWVTGADGRAVLLHTVKTPCYAPDGTLLGVLGVSQKPASPAHLLEVIRDVLDAAPGLQPAAVS